MSSIDAPCLNGAVEAVRLWRPRGNCVQGLIGTTGARDQWRKRWQSCILITRSLVEFLSIINTMPVQGMN
jgi:hypothetical protein